MDEAILLQQWCDTIDDTGHDVQASKLLNVHVVMAWAHIVHSVLVRFALPVHGNVACIPH